MDAPNAATVDIRQVTDAAEIKPFTPSLQALLQHCVNDDPATSSIGFFAPLSDAIARAHWEDLLPAAAAATTATTALLIATTSDGQLVATVQVVRMVKETHLFRGEIRKLLVHPDHRRSGLGKSMMDAAEAVAKDQMSLEVLVLDTAKDTPAREFYKRTGWTEWGICPDYAMYADGRKAECSFFVKKLS